MGWWMQTSKKTCSNLYKERNSLELENGRSWNQKKSSKCSNMSKICSKLTTLASTLIVFVIPFLYLYVCVIFRTRSILLATKFHPAPGHNSRCNYGEYDRFFRYSHHNKLGIMSVVEAGIYIPDIPRG